MAKGRFLLKRISMSEKINELSCDTSRLLYTWMLAHLDVNGDYYADPLIVKNTIFPRREDITKNQIAKYLDEMEVLGLIRRYANCKSTYLQYPDFDEKQPKIQKDREGKSEIPTPEEINSRPNQDLIQTDTGTNQAEYNEKKDNINKQQETRFKEFWAIYKNKLDPKKCRKWYDTHVTDDVHEQIKAGVARWDLSDKWINGFQENPYTFLNNERWKEEPPKRNAKKEIEREQKLKQFIDEEKT